MDRRALLALTASVALVGAARGAPEPPPTFYVLQHTPGPAWKAGVSFRDQPGVAAHVGFMKSLVDQGRLVMGGPFLDDSGGMAIVKAASLEEATKLAEGDPAVAAGLLKVTVRPWLVAMRGKDTGP